MKVRIGNDIRLRVNLLGNKNTDYINIKSIRAYIVNVTRQNDLNEQHRIDSVAYADSLEDRRRTVKYISRFPAEPYSRAYRGTPYDLMHCGHPTYHVHPVYCVAPYIGFGVHPHTFDPFCNHLYAYDDMKDLREKMAVKEEDFKQQYDNCSFLAPVSATDLNNKVDVYFPAESQIYTGTYKLVIVAKLYEPGYGKTNLRTVTMDYNEIFTLVGSSDAEGVSGDITITIGNEKQATGITLSGNVAIPVGHVGQITSTVYPTDIDDNSVSWSIGDNDSMYATIAYTDPTSCKILGLSTGEDDIKEITLTATSVKTPSISKSIKVNIVKQAAEDIYTYRGKLEGNDVNLTLTSGDVVNIDMSRETQWWEENQQ